MILVKHITKGTKLNLYERNLIGGKTYYIEKVFDEIIEVPNSSNKFKKVVGDFLTESPKISEKIKSQELTDIVEIVALYNQS